jgi:hypothetical protein
MTYETCLKTLFKQQKFCTVEWNKNMITNSVGKELEGGYRSLF